jgi:hypothetical protein
MDSPKSTGKSTQNEPMEVKTGNKSEGGIKRPQLLRLKSENGLEKSVSKILPIDQTPTPTRLLNRPEWGEILGSTQEKSGDSGKTVEASSVPQVNVNALPGPVTKTVSSVTTPAVASTVTSSNQPPAESGDAAMGGNDTTIEEIDTFGHEETVVTEETVTEEDSNDKTNFREPTTPQNEDSQPTQSTPSVGSQPVMMTTAGGQQVILANNSFGSTGNSNQMPVMVVNGNQMQQVIGNVASPMRVVSAGSGSNDAGTVTVMNTQSPSSSNQSNQAQPQQMIIPTSGGTQMIVNGTIANGGVQPFVMQQVMQIQDPQTGAIQTVITQPPQPQQFTMVQAVDPNSNNARYDTFLKVDLSTMFCSVLVPQIITLHQHIHNVL